MLSRGLKVKFTVVIQIPESSRDNFWCQCRKQLRSNTSHIWLSHSEAQLNCPLELQLFREPFRFSTETHSAHRAAFQVLGLLSLLSILATIFQYLTPCSYQLLACVIMDSSYRIRKHDDASRSDRHGSSRDFYVSILKTLDGRAR